MGDREKCECDDDSEDFDGFVEKIEPRPLPRWVTIPLGLFLAPVTLICVIGSATLVVDPNIPPTFLTVSIGSVFLAGSLWVFYLSLRLIFANPNDKSKFISPFMMRLVALVFLAIPIMAVVMGTFWEKPIIHSIMTVAYIGIFMRLWGLSKDRENA